MADEPFNESFAEWSSGNPDYLARIRDVESLDTVLAELFGNTAALTADRAVRSDRKTNKGVEPLGRAPDGGHRAPLRLRGPT